MNAAQVHLALNHFPIFAILFGVGILITGMVRKSIPFQRLSLWLFVLAALGTVPVYFTGEPAEHIVEQRATASESVVHEHELAAGFAIGGAGLLGLASVLMLFLQHRSRKLPRAAWPALAVLAVWVLSIFLRTAYLGGGIRHEEVRSTASAPAMP